MSDLGTRYRFEYGNVLIEIEQVSNAAFSLAINGENVDQFSSAETARVGAMKQISPQFTHRELHPGFLPSLSGWKHEDFDLLDPEEMS